ncbi:MAG: DUF3866 family protein [Acidimicrobiales bacterium]
MPRFVTATVTAVVSERSGIQRVEVDGQPAFVLTDLIGPVAAGDRVVVNTTAVDLGLGSGGSHVVHWNLSRQVWDRPGGGRVMKLRYTSLQVDTAAAEEGGFFHPAADLAGKPVVACDLHSQLACVALAFRQLRPVGRLVYVMTDSAALPLVLSDSVAALRDSGVLAATVTCGQAFGGDHEAVNLYSALEVADVVAGAEAVVVAPGPGVVGTRSGHGFTGMEVLAVGDAVSRLNGIPIVAVRWSGADPRPQHRGVSHHTRTVLELLGRAVKVPVPRGSGCDLPGAVAVDVPDDGWEGWAGLSSMGRSYGDDPGFFRYSAAAGVAAAQLLRG